MRTTFYAHASFRCEAAAITIVTDPYTPGPSGSGFAPIDEAADLVIMSSSTDRFHADPSHIRGDPTVVDAMTIPPEGIVVRGVLLRAFPAMESLTFDYRRDPDANAMTLFTLDGIRVLHMGDVGNPLTRAQLDALAGQVDVMFALAGAHATIALDDLDAAIDAIAPKIVIPMHYWHPRGVLDIEPVESFLARQAPAAIVRAGAPSIVIDAADLPTERRIVVLDQCR